MAELSTGSDFVDPKHFHPGDRVVLRFEDSPGATLTGFLMRNHYGALCVGPVVVCQADGQLCDGVIVRSWWPTPPPENDVFHPAAAGESLVALLEGSFPISRSFSRDQDIERVCDGDVFPISQVRSGRLFEYAVVSANEEVSA